MQLCEDRMSRGLLQEAVERCERHGSIKMVAPPPPRPSMKREDAESKKQGEWLACADSLAAAAKAEAAALAAASAESATAEVVPAAEATPVASVVASAAAAAGPSSEPEERQSSDADYSWRAWLKRPSTQAAPSSYALPGAT
jgi:hypothetical protein